MKQRIQCQNCEGKGHVLDGTNAIMCCMSVILAPLILLDRRDRNGLTRTECETCNGYGFLLEDEDDD